MSKPTDNFPAFMGAAAPSELKDRLDEYARQKGIGAAAVIRWAVEEYLNKAEQDRAA
ncbi:CopG family transcriptional regulator [Ruegeria atlantica]|uniref:Ribbon-helix-helix protein CopG domain-containing protein n=1 Tax=Ruegeria atlantica TaxID=81569 RepID=A0A0P1EYI8_9RHOB|nr:CopG family transcriptional regulator [Ruegeria atlantica]CUH45951.1 hypothetical protein RUA4292_00114 [Ruegeria atlantica]